MKHWVPPILAGTAIMLFGALPLNQIQLSKLFLLKPVTISSERSSLRQFAYLTALWHELNPERFIRQIERESGFNVEAISPAGAIGIAQILPATARSWKVDPENPTQSLDIAALKMAEYWRTYKKQGHDSETAYRMALSAYNAGPGAVAKYGKVPPYPETQHYVATIMASLP